MPQLAELSVELALKGWHEVEQKLKTTKGTAELVEAGIKKIGHTAKYAFAIGTASILGFVRAGLQGTAQGEMLHYRMQMLSREIANVFLPTINKANEYLGQAVSWFRGLNGEQQDNIRKYAFIALGILGVVGALPKLVAAAQAAMTALSALAAHPVLAGLALLAAGLAAVGVAAYLSTQQLREMQATTDRFKKGDVTKKEYEAGNTVDSIRYHKDPKTGKIEERDRDDQLNLIGQQKTKLEQELKELEKRDPLASGAKGRDYLAQGGSKFGFALRNSREMTMRGLSQFGKKLGQKVGVVGDDEETTADVTQKEKARIEQEKERLNLRQRELMGEKLKFKDGQPRHELGVTGGQWQGLGDAWRQGQANVLKMSGGEADMPTQQLKVAEQIRDNIEKVEGAVKAIKPAVV
jgi:hypothetical protein